MATQGKASATARRRARLSAPLPSASLTLADVKADEVLMSASLSRLSLSALAPLRSIAVSEARRYPALSLAADEVLSEALRRLWTSAPEVLAALTTEAAGEAHAHFRMTARSVVSNERERLTTETTEAEAERETLRLAALKADGEVLRLKDEPRSLALALAGAQASGSLSGSKAEAAESKARKAEARRFAKVRELETDHAFRIIRETSLETLMTETLRFSAPLTLTTESAGREGTAGASLSALTETTERLRFREALSLSAEALSERALSASKAEAEVLTALAEVLRLSHGERVERFYRQRGKAEAAEAEAEVSAAALAALKADGSQRGKAADVKAAARKAEALSRSASRESAALTLALRLAFSETLPSLLIILDASVSATGDASQREARRLAEVSTFDFRSLAEYASQRKADDGSLKRWRSALRSLVSEAETLAGYVGTDALTLARWRSESVKAETEAAEAAALRARAESERQRERERPLSCWLPSIHPLDAFKLSESGSVVSRPRAEAEALTAARREALALAAETAAAERCSRAERETAAALAALAEAEREAVSRWLAETLAPAAPASLSAERYRSLSEDEREAEAQRWLTLAAAADAPEAAALALSLAEHLSAREHLSAEAAALALRSLERESVRFKRGARSLAPLSLAAPPLAEVLTLAEASERRTESERAALAEAQREALAAAEVLRSAERSRRWREREADARKRYRESGSAARAERREREALARLRSAEREAAALALAEALSLPSARWQSVSEAEALAVAAEAAALKAEGGERRTLRLILSALSETEAEAVALRRLALSERTEALKAEARKAEAHAQRRALAETAAALSLALREDERRAAAPSASGGEALPRRSEDERSEAGEVLRSLRRLAGAEAETGAASLAERRKA